MVGLGQFKEALAMFTKYEVTNYMHHPYDLSMASEVHPYRALCYAQLGEKEQALNEAKIGHDLIT